MAGEPGGGGDRGDAGVAWSVLGLLLSGLAVWGGVGYLLDRWLGFHALFLPIGLLVGAGGALWLILIRYGRNDHG
jgi:F0F1-type ATP synthase assembly protein I